jgi:predicted XRE-type DNA-binding protein
MGETTPIQRGSGNVFADLGLPDADLRLAKAELALLIEDLIAKRGLTLAAAARAMGLSTADVSEIGRGRLSRFSLDRLEECRARLSV